MDGPIGSQMSNYVAMRRRQMGMLGGMPSGMFGMAGGMANGGMGMAGGFPSAMMAQNCMSGAMGQNAMMCQNGTNGMLGRNCMNPMINQNGMMMNMQSVAQAQMTRMGCIVGMGGPMNMGMPGMMMGSHIGMGGPMAMPTTMGMPGMKASPDAPMATKLKEPTLKIDSEVQELGDYFDIEDRWVERLNEAVAKRRDSKEADMAKLWEVLESAVEKTGGNPTGLLTVKIGEMESGRFVGKREPDKDVAAITKRFKLDAHVESRITEMVVLRPETRDNDVSRLERFLNYSKRPAGSVMILVGKLCNDFWEALPDLSEAEAMMKKLKLDGDACSKLADVVLKRSDSTGQYPADLLTPLQTLLDSSANPSAMLCKVASKLIDGQPLPSLPERTPQRARGAANEGKSEGSKEHGDKRDRQRHTRHDRSRSRDHSR